MTLCPLLLRVYSMDQSHIETQSGQERKEFPDSLTTQTNQNSFVAFQ